MQAGSFDTFLPAYLGFAIFFAALWCAVGFLISLLTGWFALARRFHDQAEPYGDFKADGPFFYTVYMRYWSHYSGVIRLTAAGDALYASVLFLFRIGHPPLRIPWNEIEFGREKRVWRNFVVLTLGNQEHIPVRISERMARNLGILDRCRPE